MATTGTALMPFATSVFATAFTSNSGPTVMSGDDNKVLLEGKVDSWEEREAAEIAPLRCPTCLQARNVADEDRSDRSTLRTRAAALYGGTERIVYYLTEELVRQGHDVTLFASGDSKTSAKLVPCCEMALRLNPSVKDLLPYHIIMLEAVRQRIDQFDVLHFHIDILQAPLVRGFARSRSLLSDVWRAAARLREGWGAPRNPPSLTMVL